MAASRPSPSPNRPPVVWLWLLSAAAWIAPADARAEWNQRWSSRLWNLWVLIERGEFAGHAGPQTARLCRDAVAAAFWMRFNAVSLRRWLRGPASILAAGPVAFIVLALVSRGFRGLRELIYTFLEWKIEPRHLRYDPRADFVVAHFVPIVMALLVGAVLVLICWRMLGRSGWKYWAFLAAKLLMLSVLMPLAWIELEGFLRAHLSMGPLRVALAMAFTLTFFGAFGVSVISIFADQRHRCPVCLGRLALPVRFGSWASVFDPVTTEMVCDEGHGALSVAESEISGDDRWTELDTSWREL